MLRCMARAVRGPRERCPARGLRCECKRVGAASQQQVDGAAPSLPRRMVEGGPTELTACVDRRSDVEQQRRGLDAALARRDHQCPRQIRLGGRHELGVTRAAHGRLAVAAQAVADEQVGRARLPRRTELGQHLGDVRPAACDREGVWPAAGACLAQPEVRAALGEHPHEPGGAVAIDGPRYGPVELVPARPRRRAVLEQQRDQLAVLAVEGMRQRVRSRDGRSRLEQEPNAREIARLGRVVQGLAVVGIGAPSEQDAREARLVCDAGGAVERALCAELRMRVRRVRIGARVEQALGRGHERVAARSAEVARVRDVDQRLPAERRQGRPRIDIHRRAHHERRGRERAQDRRVGLEQGVCVVDSIGGRGTHERLGALAPACGLPLGAPDESRASSARRARVRPRAARRRAVARLRRPGSAPARPARRPARP